MRCEFDRKHDEVLAVEVLPRRTLLARANLRGESEAIVANVTQLVVVVAPLPQPDYFIVDRYLCAATAAGLSGTVAVNKSDLAADGIDPAELAAFAARGLRARHLFGEIRLGNLTARRRARQGGERAGGTVGRGQVVAGERTAARGGGADRRAHA